MDTNKLKKFAVEARNKIKAGVEAKLSTLGFDAKGNVPDSMKPQLMQGGSLWNGQLMTEGFYHQWMALYDAVKRHGVRDVYEEAAYTWFNRLVAIRILQKNGLISPVLTYADAARTPQIVDDARSLNRIPPMPEADRQRLMELLDDDTKVTEQFAILITAYCHDNPIIRKSFGRMADYTELLLPNNILAENGFIDDLNRMSSESNDELAQSLPSREGGRPEANHTEFITDEDYKSSELIGWLYQFYISERKDEVFAKKGKYDADEIAPATQIFTPHWIVEYMVQNTIGRIYLDNHPEAIDEFKPKWKYLVGGDASRVTKTNKSACDASRVTEGDSSACDASRVTKTDKSPCDAGRVASFAELTDLRFADLGCGSGHILGYMFDILFDLYIYEGYTRKEAVENILRYNITGVDIDLRAKQLATFALLLKACQKDESFRDGTVLPHVLTMPEPIAEANRHKLFHEFFQGEETNNILAELDDAFDLLKDAQTLGSIMKFDLSKSTLLAIRQTMDYWKDQSIVPDSVTRLLPSFRIILALTQKYTALVMNPPYMGSSKFNNVLSKYVKDNYAIGKADLATVFVQVMPQHLVLNGKYAFIIPPSWMFLTAFEGLRKEIIEDNSIDSLLHLSRGVFGADFGSSSAVISNTKPTNNTIGIYFRLIERTFQEFDQKHLRMLFEKTLENHDFKYKFSDYSKDVTDIVYSADGAKVYYPNVKQKDFEKIPGCPIGYWVSEKLLKSFSNGDLTKICETRCGLATGRNDLFLRLWYEVNFYKIGFGCSRKEAQQSGEKWFPYDKAGEFRKWYGNLEYVLDWQDDGKVLQNTMHPDGTRIWAHNFNLDKIFQPHIGWSDIISGGLSFRYYGKGFNFDGSANAAFVEDSQKIPLILGYSNSKVVSYIRPLLNPTIHFKPGNFLNLPFKDIEFNNKSVIDNITISKLDWDAHETSWDFAENPLVAIMKEATRPASQTDGFATETSHYPAEAADDHGVVSPLPKRGNDVAKAWYDDYHGAVTELGRLSGEGATPMGALGSTTRDASAPMGALGDTTRDASAPMGALGNTTRDASAPMGTLGNTTRDASAPMGALGSTTRDASTPMGTLELCVNAFEKLWTARFMQLHANEEKLNRQFIDIYGLQEELTPDVPLNEITILQQGEISIE